MTASTSPIREVVIVDPSVSDWKTLTAGINPNIPVILLPAGGNGLESIANALSSYSTLDAVHLVSHGGVGRLSLGDLQLTNNNLAAQSDALAAIASHLTPDSDLLIYGCSVAAGDNGHTFVNALSSALNGVDIAASTDRTGPLSLGGDWDLEYTVGHIETVLPFTVQGMEGIDECLGCLNGAINFPICTSFASGGGGGGGPSTPSAPSTPDLIAASDSGASNSDNITKITTPTFTGTATSGATVTLYDGSTVLGTATATGGNWSITPSSSLAAGSHSITAKATVSGNTSAASSALAVTIDTTAPTTTIASAAFSADTGSSPTDFITKTTSQTLSGTLSANLATGETVNVSLDNGTTWNAATASVGSSTWSLTSQTLTSSNTLKVKVTDTAGNDGTVFSQAYTLDTTAPSAGTPNRADLANPSGTSFTFTVTYSDTSGSGLDTSTFGTGNVSVKDANHNTLSVTGASASGNTVTYTVSAPGGTWDAGDAGTGYTIDINGNSVKDLAGNAVAANANAKTFNVTFNTAPTLGGTFTTAGTVNDNSTVTPFAGVTVADAQSDPVSIAITYTAANGTLSGTGLTGSAGNYTLSPASLATVQGYLQALVFTPTANQVTAGSTVATTFTLTPNDGTINGTSNATTVVTATSINDAPTNIALSANTVSVFDSTNATVGTLSDTDVDGASASYSIVSITDPNSNAVAGAFTISGTTLQAATPSTLSSGSYTVRVQVDDGSGGTYQKDLSVTVSNSLIVTTGSDTGADATIDSDYTTDASDGGGLSFREALNYASGGNTTIGFAAGLAGQTITLGSNATVASGTTLDADTVGTLTINGQTLNLAGAFNISNGSGDTLTLGSILSGTGTLTKTGGGTLTLSGINSYSGTTTISAGTLSIADHTIIGGGGQVTLNGGTLKLTGAGSTNIGGAVYDDLPNDVVIGSSGGTIDTASMQSGNQLALHGALTGSGTLTTTGHTLNFWNADSFNGDIVVTTNSVEAFGTTGFGNGTVTLNAGTTVYTSGNTRSIANNIVLAGNAGLHTDSAGFLMANGAVITFSGNISESGGARSLTLQNDDSSNNNAIILSGTNTYTGSTTIAADTKVSVAADNNLGQGGISLASNATLAITGSNTIDNTVTLTGNASINVEGSVAAVLSGAISGSSKALTKTGTGTLTLSGTNTYTGATTVSGGNLATGTANVIADTSAVSVSTGATLTLGGSDTIGSLSGAGSVALGTYTLTAGKNNTSTTFSGVIGGSGGLTKSGTGTLTLSGANTYAGATTISAGKLTTGGANVIADTSAVNQSAGTTLTLGGNDTVGSLSGGGTVALGAYTLTAGTNGTSTNFAGAISGTGGLTKNGTGTLTLSGAQKTYTGATTVSGGNLATGGANVIADASAVSVATGATLTLGGNDTVGSLSGAGTVALGANTLTAGGDGTSTTFSGVIGGTGGLTKTGTGTLTLSGTNTYTGATAISAGSLTTSTANVIADTSAVSVSAGATLTLGGNDTIGSLSGAGSVALGANTLTAGADGTSTTFSGVIGGSGGLTKNGSGTLTLSGANTYTGATTISAGSLTTNAADLIADASAVSVATGAILTLGGNDTVGSLSGAGTVALGTHTLTTGGDGTSTTFSGVIGGTGGLTKTGAGTLTLAHTTSPMLVRPSSMRGFWHCRAMPAAIWQPTTARSRLAVARPSRAPTGCTTH